MNFTHLVWLLILTFPTISYALQCEIKGYEFVAQAKLKHWPTIESKVVSGSGACSVVTDAAISAGASGSDGVDCEITFFRGGYFKAPWKLEQIKFAGAEVSFPVAPKYPASSATVVVRTVGTSYKSSSLNLAKIVLSTSGSDCDKWREAL